MDPIGALVVAAAVLYGIDCCVYVGEPDWTLVGWGRRWRLRRGPALALGQRGGLVFGSLWPPLNPVARCGDALAGCSTRTR